MHTITYEELDDQFQDRQNAPNDADLGELTFRADIAGQLYTVEVSGDTTEWRVVRGPNTDDSIRTGSFDPLDRILRKMVEATIMSADNQDIMLSDRDGSLDDLLSDIEDEYGEWFPRNFTNSRYREVFGVESGDSYEVASADIEVAGADFTVQLGYYHSQRYYLTIIGPNGNQPIARDDIGQDPADIRYNISEVLGAFLDMDYTNPKEEMVFHQ